jgi:nucleoid DNA-binding protein
MIIGKYIKMLLDERRVVILPGFGNLEVKLPEGEESPSGKRINPPGVSVRFDSGFSKDDKGLAEALAAGEELENEEAHQRVLELVDAIKFELDKGEEFLLPGTGTFSRDDDGKIHFQADPAWVLEPGLYGLESMDLLELEELPEEESGEEAEPEIRAAPNVTPLAAPVPQPGPRRWRVIWLVAITLIVVLVILILIPPKEVENGDEGGRFFNRKPNREVVKQDKPSRDKRESEADVPAVTPEPENPVPEPEVEQPSPVSESNRYFIVAGSFKNLKNASDLQDKLKEKGYQAEVMITENRMYRVSVASYATKEEAEKGLIEINAVPGLQSCWLLSN